MLGVTAAVAVAAAASVTLIGRSNSPKHNAVARYINDVDLVQQQMQSQLTKTVTAYRDFTRGKKGVTPRLAQSEVILKRLESRLVALPAPAPATRLRMLLIRLTGAEVGVAHEVTLLSRFSGPYAALLHRAKAAGTVLSHSLAAVKPPVPHKIRGTRKQVKAAQAAFNAAASAAAAQQADAVDVYDARVGNIERALRKLDPPPVLTPSFRTQLQTLSASRTAGAALSKELRKKDRSHVAVVGRKFTLAARIAGSISAQKAQIAAIKAYNRRVRAIGTLQGDIRQELARLQSLTG